MKNLWSLEIEKISLKCFTPLLIIFKIISLLSLYEILISLHHRLKLSVLQNTTRFTSTYICCCDKVKQKKTKLRKRFELSNFDRAYLHVSLVIFRVCSMIVGPSWVSSSSNICFGNFTFHGPIEAS